MEEITTTFKNESKVKKIGGRVAKDYTRLKEDIEYINRSFFKLFSLLGLADNIDLMVENL